MTATRIAEVEPFHAIAISRLAHQLKQEGRSIIGLYPPTDEQSRSEFAAWRLARGR